MRRTHGVFLISCCLLFAASVRPLDPGVPITQYVHEVWRSKDGLPQNSINNILQTRDGYLWMTTYEGLIRFDGVRFSIFDGSNTPGIACNRMINLFEQSDRSLWISTEDERIIRMKDGGFESYSVEGHMGGRILSVIEKQRDDLWIVTADAAYQAVKKRFVKAELGEVIHFSEEDRRIGAVLEWGPRKDEIEAYFENSTGISKSQISSVYEDAEGSIWIGTEENGLHQLKKPYISSYTSRDGLKHDYAYFVFQDRRSVIWAGTKGGLARLEKSQKKRFESFNDLSGCFVHAIGEGKDGSLWVSTGDVLNMIQNGRIENYTSKGIYAILSIHEDKADNLWIGTWAGGLNLFKNGRFTAYTTKDGLVNDIVRCIHEDKEGNLWLGTDGGVTKVVRVQGLGVREYGKEGGRLKAEGNQKAESEKRKTEGGCTFTNFTTKEGLSDNHVRVIYEDTDGVLWIGTYGGGMNRFKDGKFTQIKPKDGLFDKVVSWILEDDHGNFWMTCNRGIYRASRKDLNDFCDGKSSSIECISYDESDGMVTAECNGGSSPAGWKARDGKLWFPTFKGVVCVDPNHLLHNPLPPPVVVEEVTIDGKAADFKSSPRLDHGKGDLEVKYTALSFVNPKKVKFKYRLDGYDTDWVAAGIRRTAYYTNLPTGRLKFRVIACNNDGVWNREGASFEFTFKPHLYQTPWAFGFYFLCLAAGVWGLIWYRTRRLRKKAEMLLERTEMAREIHDTLAQGISGTLLQLRMAKEALSASVEDVKRHLDRAEAASQKNLAEARRSIKSLRFDTGMDAEFPSTLRHLVEPMGREAGLDVGFDLPEDFPAIPYKTSTALLRIAQEAVANVIKHAKAGRVFVALSAAKTRIRLIIADDGEGFDPQTLEPSKEGGFGILGMRERARLSKGALAVDSAPGNGTKITVDMPTK